MAYKWPVAGDALANATHLQTNGAMGAATGGAAGAAPTQPWPATLPEQVKAVAQLLVSNAAALTLAQIEARFTGRGAWKKSLPTLLQTLQALGRAQQTELGGNVVWRA